MKILKNPFVKGVNKMGPMEGKIRKDMETVKGRERREGGTEERIMRAK